MEGKYTIISGDSHLDLAPDRWTHRVPAKWKPRAPKRVRLESGEDAIVIEDRPPAPIGFTRSVGVSHEKLHLQIPTFENSAGTGNPEQRLREQDQDGVQAEILFSRTSLLRAVKEDEGYVALVHAYNEYLAEEYCAAAPDRLLAMGVIPTTNINDAVAELEYCKRAGLKGVLLDRFPNGTGHPTPEDNRFWAAAVDLNMPLTSHTGGGSTRFRDKGPSFLFPHRPETDRGNPFSQMFRFCGDAAYAPMQMAFAGVWDRFPKLQIYWAETMAGWLPFALWQIDDHYERYQHLWKALWGLGPLKHKPSEYLREHCLWGFLYDPVGVSARAATGADKLIWGSDFAHAASDWPNSRESIEKSFSGVPQKDRDSMLAGNVVKFFHLDA
jgi:predicted TIM-barrel fold metal-dependent hydrolase